MILNCGEALIDMLPREARTGEPCFAPVPGGAVFNTAIALARLGAASGFFSGLSRDLFGQMLTRALDRDGVTSRAALSDRPTTLAFVTLSAEGQARYAFYDENTAGRMIAPGDTPPLDGIEALFFGGISLVVEPCAATYEALQQAAVAAGLPVMIDPNIRPGFVTDEPGYRARLGRMIARADVVKISDEDLHWLRGPGDAVELARGLLDEGPRLVCLTLGAEGAVGVTARHEIRVPARRAVVVDTVGAGDTFNAGVLAALSEAGRLTRAGLAALDADAIGAALDLGARAAAVTVSRAGANPPRRDELPG
ncbi:carbohydrate kinase [Palleronia sediminis]|uniref:Carbohydrate kinase n=1 Tax=Palleronia sediminis TaxID=2547833 RepID=A0A4R6AIT2_9RHOB|nr:carbohydrate kinase [Palleronia sediminis]TDL81293.1 carbohydrate kinase [Palleronia sediminis]